MRSLILAPVAVLGMVLASPAMAQHVPHPAPAGRLCDQVLQHAAVALALAGLDNRDQPHDAFVPAAPVEPHNPDRLFIEHQEERMVLDLPVVRVIFPRRTPDRGAARG